MEFHGREIQHCACHDCSRSTVMANLVYGAAKGCVSAGACSANGIDRATDAEDFGNAAGMISIQSMQRLHRIHEVWFFSEPKALVVQIVEIDVMSRNDGGYSVELDSGLTQARIQKSIQRHQDRQPRGPCHAVDKLPHPFEHVGRDMPFKTCRLAVNVVVA